MSFFAWIVVIGALAWFINSAAKRALQAENEKETFAGQYRGWDVYTSAHDRGALAIDHENRQIAIGTVDEHSTLPWDAIVSVEIERNGESISQTNRGSQAVGAAVGALLLGPLGLLMGGLTGSKRNRQRVSELALKVTLDDRVAPVRRIVFFRMAGNGTDAKAPQLKEPVAKLEHFHALLLNAIRTAAAHLTAIADGNRLESNSAKAIAELWELVQCGALSQAEFDTEKQMILNKGGQPAIGQA